jgi:hypothetical protein
MPYVGRCQAAQHSLLGVIDSELRRYQVALAACLYLDEAECRALPGDKVYVTAGNTGPAPTPGYDRVTVPLQMPEGGVFATLTDAQMLRLGGLPSQHRGKLFQPEQRTLLKSGHRVKS